METTTLDDEKFCRVLSEAVHEVTGESVPEGFTLDSPLGDLGVDSLTRMEVVTVLEDRFCVRVDSELLPKVSTGRHLFDAIRTADRI
ncbi:acyl carrier protein [Streptomyces sp. WAC 01438]|uniref:acyl carrier protein n=1 Tax=Streptomyces sp. WAC 01438 TaxID=2203204 RepID=UPI000F6E66BA|nr:acyl carrier protein [Streptomyces sp. WAC 01438]AZM62123.1 hypothetical protein DLM49_23625 [Streptomyces sp. WAC 01438]